MITLQFDNQVGWYAFISLLILLILYLIKPKPKDTNIPSLMFFIKTSGATKQNSFLRHLVNNLLFFLQFLALTLLAFSLTYPYINVPKVSVEQDTAIVLDISASMSTKTGTSTRFDEAVSKAKENLGRDTSIIFATQIPVIALEKGSKERANEILAATKVKDSSSNIGDAILLAGSTLGNKGKIVVISDMKQTDGIDIDVAVKAMAAKGLEVNLINVGSEAENYGIIELKVTKRQIEAKVKNYNEQPKELSLVLSSTEGRIEQKKTVIANSIELFAFETPAGNSKLEITQKDDFETDNTVYIVGPASKKVNVLMVSNSETSSVKTALQASKDIELGTATPPVIPNLNYDIIILDKFSKDLILPGFYTDLAKRIAKGQDVIITAQQGIDKLDFELMPVKFGRHIKNQSEVTVQLQNYYTTGIEFGRVNEYYQTETKATVLATTENENPLIVVRTEGTGNVVYYGIFDESSDFKNSVSYPIFWNKMINNLYSSQNLDDFNTKTDKVLPIEKQKIQTPYGEVETTRLFFDKIGFYKIGEDTISSSLLNEKESDVSTDAKSEQIKSTQEKNTEELAKKSFIELAVIFGLVFVILELLVAKIRGDI